MTLTDEQIEAIRLKWDGVRGTVPLQKFAMKYIPALLSALEAANKRADEAEALVRMLEDAETVEIIQTLRARVAELEGALKTIACHPIENFCMGRPDLGIPGYASCQDVARSALKGASHAE